MTYLKNFFVIALILLSFSSMAEFKEGVHYERVSALPSQEKFVSVYFNYGCPACYQTEPLVEIIRQSVPENTPVELVPFENNPAWRVYVQAFYIAEMLGIEKQAHDALFHRVHVEKKPVANLDLLKSFFVDLGVDAKRFDQAAKSFQLDGKLRQARKKAIANRVVSTPSFVVNDRFIINRTAFTTNEQLVEAINYLLTQ